MLAVGAGFRGDAELQRDAAHRRAGGSGDALLNVQTGGSPGGPSHAATGSHHAAPAGADSNDGQGRQGDENAAQSPAGTGRVGGAQPDAAGSIRKEELERALALVKRAMGL